MNQVRPAGWRTWTVLLGALMVVAAAASCSGGDDDDDPTTTIDVEVNDTTTSTTPATTTTLSEADRFRTLAVDLITARNGLFQRPPADPAASLAEIIDPQCDCFVDELGALEDMIAQGGRFSGPPSMPLGARFAGANAASGFAFVDMALDASPRQLVGPDGSVIRELSGSDPFALSVGLIERDGGWVIDVLAPLEVDRAFVDELVAEGLP